MANVAYLSITQDTSPAYTFLTTRADLTIIDVQHAAGAVSTVSVVYGGNQSTPLPGVVVQNLGTVQLQVSYQPAIGETAQYFYVQVGQFAYLPQLSPVYGVKLNTVSGTCPCVVYFLGKSP